jgi:methylphosphotriester-DNA--protein-cysteine methyltransferase
MMLALPQDKRLALLAGDALPPPLQQLAARCGASEKTISRIFRRDTGMTYQQWRQQWRLMKAVELLATGERITDRAGAGFRQRQRLYLLFPHHDRHDAGALFFTADRT